MCAEMSRLDYRLRIGVLVPSSNTVMENDLHQALPKSRYTVHAARMYLEETTAAAERRPFLPQLPWRKRVNLRRGVRAARGGYGRYACRCSNARLP
jgi:hypothetical protein